MYLSLCGSFEKDEREVRLRIDTKVNVRPLEAQNQQGGRTILCFTRSGVNMSETSWCFNERIHQDVSDESKGSMRQDFSCVLETFLLTWNNP